MPKDRVANSLIDILHYKGIANNDQREPIRALALFSEKSIDILDCILCAKIAGRGDTLFSFNEELNKVARRL
mgnify:FL=1